MLLELQCPTVSSIMIFSTYKGQTPEHYWCNIALIKIKAESFQIIKKSKTYVVFVGRKPGVYETWEEAHRQVNKFSGASHKSFWSRDEASKAFHAYLEKQNSSASFMPEEESSCATFSTAPNRSTEAEKLLKVKDLLLDLENENRNHLLKVAGIAEEIKQLVQSLQISGED